MKTIHRAFKFRLKPTAETEVKFKPNKRIPTFKKKGVDTASFSYPQGFKVDQELNRVFLPKIGWVKYINSRKIIGVPKNITISEKAGHWYASIQVEYDTTELEHESTSIVGIDVGIY